VAYAGGFACYVNGIRRCGMVGEADGGRKRGQNEVGPIRFLIDPFDRLYSNWGVLNGVAISTDLLPERLCPTHLTIETPIFAATFFKN
jgi:hypothetical protein